MEALGPNLSKLAGDHPIISLTGALPTESTAAQQYLANDQQARN